MDKEQHEFSEVLQNVDQYLNLSLRKKNDLNMTKHKKILGGLKMIHLTEPSYNISS